MQVKKKVTVVKNIRSTGGQNGLPGNYLINTKMENGKPSTDSWFPSRDIRNSLLGNGLNSRIPCLWLVGCTLTHEILTVEQADVDQAKLEGKKGFEYKVDNRKDPIVFTQPGVHNINVQIDMSALPVEKLMMVSDLSMKYARALAPAVAPVTPSTETAEEIIDDHLEDTPPVITPDEVLTETPAETTT